MIFDIQYKDPKVYDGYAIASEVLCSTELSERVREIVKITYSKESPRAMVDALHLNRLKIMSGINPQIRVKQYFYRSKSVIATTGLKEDPEAIFVNSLNVPRASVLKYVGNAAHEFGHKPMGFGHGSNWTQETRFSRMMCLASGDLEDKTFSVPYIMERLVIQIAKEKRLIR